MIYEILENGVVVNTIVADEDFMLANYPDGNYRESEQLDQPTVPVPIYEWYIDIGPFFDRFGAAKMAVLTSSDVGVQAIIKDTQVRKWLDLKLPEIASVLAYIGTKVPSVTQELQQSILNTPVEEKDNLALRKLYFS